MLASTSDATDASVLPTSVMLGSDTLTTGWPAGAVYTVRFRARSAALCDAHSTRSHGCTCVLTSTACSSVSSMSTVTVPVTWVKAGRYTTVPSTVYRATLPGVPSTATLVSVYMASPGSTTRSPASSRYVKVPLSRRCVQKAVASLPGVCCRVTWKGSTSPASRSVTETGVMAGACKKGSTTCSRSLATSVGVLATEEKLVYANSCTPCTAAGVSTTYRTAVTFSVSTCPSSALSFCSVHSGSTKLAPSRPSVAPAATSVHDAAQELDTSADAAMVITASALPPNHCTTSGRVKVTFSSEALACPSGSSNDTRTCTRLPTGATSTLPSGAGASPSDTTSTLYATVSVSRTPMCTGAPRLLL